MSTTSDTPVPHQPQRGGVELLPLLMIGAVAVMLAIAGRIDRGGPVIEAKATSATEASQVADAGEEEAAAAAGPVSAAERAKIEGVVRDYLLKNPEILAEVQSAFEAKMDEQRTAQMAGALKENAQSLYKATSSPFIGAAEPEVTVVEFFDYNCGFCRRAMPDIIKLTSGDPKVKFVFKEFPIFGKDSEAAARAALAAGKQGKYWEMHKGLFEHEGKLNEEVALSVAQGLGLDVEKLKTDMTSPETEKEIDETRALAEKLGIQGTPHFFVGDQVIPGAPEDLHDQLQSKIADIRKSGCSIC